jgi:3-phenylpropionate/trans-cinnamate dioxygenase ferredoxin reductase subunit
MPHSTYLIIGGGMTADAAVKGIRAVDPNGAIAVVSAEDHPPYDRPPLSKALWKEKSEDEIWRGAAREGAELFLGRRVRGLDLEARRATDEQGTAYTYERLLLATGGTPRRFPFASDPTLYYRTVDDYRRLRRLAEKGRSFVVIGSGFIGSELAAALAVQGCRVTLLFPEEGVGRRVFPRSLSLFLNEYYRERGVEVLPGRQVVGVERSGEGVLVGSRLSEGMEPARIHADAAVAGLGILPGTELAASAGLAVGDGIVVDEMLRAGREDVFAAGDVASYPSAALGVRRRVEHEDNALAMGERAGRNMAGDLAPYRHLPMFYSDLFDLGYEAVGELDSRLETVAEWSEENRKGVVYYLEESRVRGVLLWNVWEQVEAARRLIAEPGPFHAEDLMGLLPA